VVAVGNVIGISRQAAQFAGRKLQVSQYVHALSG
jgi:hypothetical protein